MFDGSAVRRRGRRPFTPSALFGAVSTTALATALMWPGSAAHAACTPNAPVSNTTVTCSGTTTDQNPPNGYGTGTTESGLTINVQTGAIVSGTGAGGDGLSIVSDNQVNNSGNINGVNNGINAFSNLTVVNNAASSIAGANNGIFVAGLGNVTNSGDITGTAAGSSGISINGTGSATVGNSGNISGVTFGVFGGSATDFTITNSGTISGGTAGSGVAVIGGSLNITNSGTFSGSVAAGSTTGTLILDNQLGGIVTSANNAISAGNTANITNAGAITGNTFAVAVTNDVAVTNSGGITTTAGSGSAVQSQNGNITLSNSGNITGVWSLTNVIFAGAGNINITSNTGNITAGGQAVVAAATGNVTFNNGAGGNISGGTAGIAAAGGTISGTNAGTISGGAGGALGGSVVNVTNSGNIVATNPVLGVIFASTSANITNNAGANITTANGFAIFAASVMLNNSGNITGGGASGLGVAGSTLNITNNAGATISGGLDGVNQQSHIGAVINNAGSISGAARSGLRLDSNATVTNTGNITGLAGIVFRDATGTNTPVVNGSVFNSGTITGTGGTAINFAATPGSGPFTLTLGPGSIINGNVLGTGGDVLQLGGTGADTFNVGNIGAAQQYRGFTAFNKIGSSTWTLIGTNAAALPWTINGGTLAANGTMINSSMAVNGGGTLEGIGTVGSITVNSGGTLMPGLPAAVGTLAAGPVTFASGATYVITINGASSSKVNSSGIATLNSGASVGIASGSTFNFGQKYTILTASGGVNGQFNPNVTFGGFSGTLSYDAHDVFLTFALNLCAAGGRRARRRTWSTSRTRSTTSPTTAARCRPASPGPPSADVGAAAGRAHPALGRARHRRAAVGLPAHERVHGAAARSACQAARASGIGALPFAPDRAAGDVHARGRERLRVGAQGPGGRRSPPTSRGAPGARPMGAPTASRATRSWWAATTSAPPRAASRPALDYRASPDTVLGLALAGAAHRLGPVGRPQLGPQRRLPGRALRQAPVRAGLSRRRARLRQPLGLDQPRS